MLFQTHEQVKLTDVKGIGSHLFADLYGVDSLLLTNELELMRMLFDALICANFNIIKQFSYKFPSGGSGVTGMFLLSESHAAFHTYPEQNYMALDIFSCGQADPQTALSIALKVLQPYSFKIKMERRGNDC
ncbi:S-adenosylmethionine decarboxylase proenzyme [Calothrix sp. NIES-2100]|uniref:adenosylmethionine decarboxylase n=1 Tax=Calothrix sp. NIES-2100 TaxID=1954172 RepID=UPI000B6213FB|nr:S-adenosylmethionine decarboxylase proenzyme [Calothrix sp. NIES-2100]